MSAALIRLAGPILLTTADTLVYTVPAGKKTIVHSILAMTGAASPQPQVSVSIGPDAPGTRIFHALLNISVTNQGGSLRAAIPLSAGETLYASADANNGAALTIIGEEIPV